MSRHDSQSASFLAEGGTSGQLARSIDWSQTVLGPPESWPSSLKTTVAMLLKSRHPMFLWWGEELIQFYNDAYLPSFGRGKHPAAMGQRGADCWQEIWPIIWPQIDDVMSRGIPSWHEDALVPIWRNGRIEEVYWTYGYSPIFLEDGAVGGTLVVCTETTRRVIRQRRSRQLQLLSEKLSGALSAESIVDGAAEVLSGSVMDVPFALLYSCDKAQAKLMRAVGLDDDERDRVDAVFTARLRAASGTDAFTEPVLFELGPVRPRLNPWPELPRQLLAVPVGGGAGKALQGFIVFGVSPRLTADAAYHAHFDGIARVISQALTRVELERTSRVILESITDAFLAIDREWRFTYTNRHAEKVLGRQPGELLGKNMWDEYPGLLGTDFEQLYRRTAREQVAGSLTAFYPDHQRWYEVHAYPGPEGISLYFRDVNDRVAAHEALRRSERRYRLLFDSIDQGFCVIQVLVDDAGEPCDYRFLETNPAFEKQTGLSDAVGKTMRSLIPEHEEHWFRIYGEIARTGKPMRFENSARAMSRWYDVYAFRVGEAEKRTVAVLFSDITARKQADEALREQDRRKEEFLATLAHELRNPLAPIRNGLEILRSTSTGRTGDVPVRQMIERQVNLMCRMVDDLLDVSRISRGAIALRSDLVSLAGLLVNAVETSKPLIDSSGHRLTITVPHQPLFVEVDAVRMAQVFGNLLNNAAKFTNPGGHIEVSGVRVNDDVVVTVRDNGIGIPPERLPAVFDMFTQLDSSSTRANSGLGIGLTLVRNLVELHGGSVVAHSDGLGKGAEFHVRLPLARDSGVRPEQPRAHASALDAHRVLVVDDNRDAADSIAVLLRLMGAEVHVVYDGPSALAAVDTFNPTVALLDIGMPGMDGYEVAVKLRGNSGRSDLTLVALSGWGLDEDRRRTGEAGFDHHLTKPVPSDDLRTLLTSLPSRGVRAT